MAERHRWNGCMSTLGGVIRLHESRQLGIHPELLMVALKKLQSRGEAPRELAKELVLLVRPRRGRVGAWLTVVVAQVLISGEEPHAIASDRDPEIRRQILLA